MRIAASPYELVARADGRRRAGALLRVDFPDGVRGYADLHPWPELGDVPLDRQFADPTILSARSLALARADGEGRATGRSLFEGLTVPESHASLPFGFSADALSQAAKDGYRLAKVEGWTFNDEELALFRDSGLRFRLDFNARLDFEEVQRLLDAWGDLDWIDWLEDPCPYESSDWQALRSRVRLALDFEPGDMAYDVRVVKPARDVSPTRDDTGAFAFTSYLDHPVGQLGAAWEAARAVADGLHVEPGGLATHDVYEPTPFSQALRVERGRLMPPGGPGLGFVRELAALEWRTLEP